MLPNSDPHPEAAGAAVPLPAFPFAPFWAEARAMSAVKAMVTFMIGLNEVLQ
jgi:hypothetical protein